MLDLFYNTLCGFVDGLIDWNGRKIKQKNCVSSYYNVIIDLTTFKVIIPGSKSSGIISLSD